MSQILANIVRLHTNNLKQNLNDKNLNDLSYTEKDKMIELMQAERDKDFKGTSDYITMFPT